MKPNATNRCWGSKDKNHHVGGGGRKQASSWQSSLMNDENEGKACDDVNCEVRVTALKTDSRKSVSSLPVRTGIVAECLCLRQKPVLKLMYCSHCC